MTCAKQKVICTIQCLDGSEVVGENYCRRPQNVCPRDTHGHGTGEGYHLCHEICQQVGHAERVAVSNLKGRVPVKAELEGHSYACEPCKAAMREVGLKEIVIDGSVHKL